MRQTVRRSQDVTEKAKGGRCDSEPDDRDKPVSGLPRSRQRPRLQRTRRHSQCLRLLGRADHGRCAKGERRRSHARARDEASGQCCSAASRNVLTTQQRGALRIAYSAPPA